VRREPSGARKPILEGERRSGLMLARLLSVRLPTALEAGGRFKLKSGLAETRSSS
jgi:hypothetical protein